MNHIPAINPHSQLILHFWFVHLLISWNSSAKFSSKMKTNRKTLCKLLVWKSFWKLCLDRPLIGTRRTCEHTLKVKVDVSLQLIFLTLEVLPSCIAALVCTHFSVMALGLRQAANQQSNWRIVRDKLNIFCLKLHIYGCRSIPFVYRGSLNMSGWPFSRDIFFLYGSRAV